MSDTKNPGKHRRIVGAERQTLAKDLVKRYSQGESIRALASSTGRSYGFVHRVLTESGVQPRGRGGPNNKNDGGGARTSVWTEEDVGQLKELAGRGWSASRIGGRLGRSQGSVQWKLGKLGMKRRKVVVGRWMS